MPTDWTKPFPRDALVITRPDSEEVIFGRPAYARGTFITLSLYHSLEAERLAWVEQRDLSLQQSWESQEREKVIMGQRRMAKELREFHADDVLKKVLAWKRYADMSRWDELGEWLDAHPQRLSEDDYLFGILDLPKWKDPAAFEKAPRPEKRRGRPRGTPNSKESNQLRSVAAKARWARLHDEGWVHPATANKQEAQDRKDKEPY